MSDNLPNPFAPPLPVIPHEPPPPPAPELIRAIEHAFQHPERVESPPFNDAPHLLEELRKRIEG